MTMVKKMSMSRLAWRALARLGTSLIEEGVPEELVNSILQKVTRKVTLYHQNPENYADSGYSDWQKDGNGWPEDEDDEDGEGFVDQEDEDGEDE